jgi:hypothetical protein
VPAGACVDSVTIEVGVGEATAEPSTSGHRVTRVIQGPLVQQLQRPMSVTDLVFGFLVPVPDKVGRLHVLLVEELASGANGIA